MDYLDFVEDYKKETDINLFEKIMVATKRVMDLYENTTVSFENKTNLKPVSCAIYEINKGYIEPNIKSQEADVIKNLLIDDDGLEDS